MIRPTTNRTPPRFPWEQDPNPRIQELDDERALLVCELGIETDPALIACRRDLIFALEQDIDTLRKVGNARVRAVR